MKISLVICVGISFQGAVVARRLCAQRDIYSSSQRNEDALIGCDASKQVIA